MCFLKKKQKERFLTLEKRSASPLKKSLKQKNFAGFERKVDFMESFMEFRWGGGLEIFSLKGKIKSS